MLGSTPTLDRSKPPLGASSELSLAQERIWVLERMAPGSAVYNLPLAFRFEGPLHPEALEWGLAELVRRHEALRATFPAVEDRPVQLVRDHDDEARILAEVDVPDGDEPARMGWVMRACEEESRRPFDLARGPLMRGVLFRLSASSHVLIVLTHHIIFDGWSVGVFTSELAGLYASFLEGRPSPLPGLPMAPSEVHRRQRQRLGGEAKEKLVSYWRKKLEGCPRRLALPTDHRPPDERKSPGARYPIELDEGLTSSLKALGRGEGTTLFTTLQAALLVLLHRYTGSEDLLICTPTAGRDRVETRPLIGFFVNLLVLRTDLSGRPTFRELLDRVRRTTFEAYAHQELPFHELIGSLNPERGPTTGTPLIQVMLALQNYPMPPAEFPGLASELLDVHTGTAKFDLTLELQERGGRLVGWFEYDRELFEVGTIARMAGHLLMVLGGAVADPDLHLSELPLLTRPERRQLLGDWNGHEAEIPHDRCLHHLFEEQVERTPEGVALVFEGEELTFGGLNSRANRLAHQLRAMGVGPDMLVAICAERSPEMVVGLLGILKAGGAYLPLDPEHPPERLASILADSRARILLSQSGLAGEWVGPGVRVLRLDADRPVVERHPSTNPEGEARPSNLAYCLYTSGSTGRPKGVALEHANAVAFLAWARLAFPGLGTDRVLFATSLGFDLSVFELFAPLVTGGTVLLVRDALALIGSHAEPTLINTVPSVIEVLADSNAIPESVRTINLAGEPLRRELVARLRAIAPRARVYNLYGPTECTTYSTYGEVDGRSRVGVGRPVLNTQVYILDDRLEPVPIGIGGEIYIAGAGVARGYWGRPELTAERFVPNPFGAPGGRMYRTGDLGRYLPDGSIEFLGRIDHQVKIRGCRIELGEVESSLLRREGVAKAVVVACEDPAGGRRLVAYVVAVGTTATEPALRSALRASLPDYMIPSAFVFLDELPLTRNGKVDRKALPVPGAAEDRRGAEYVAPRSPLEGALAEIVGEVLKLDRVGAHDDFFSLGGHSLLMIRLVGQIRRDLGVSLPLNVVFRAPTVAQLASALREVEGIEAGAPPAVGRVSGPPFFCLSQAPKLARHLDGIAVYPLGSYADDLRDYRSIEEIASANLVRLREIQGEGPYRLSGFCGMALVAFEMARRLLDEGEEVSLLALIDPPSVDPRRRPTASPARYYLGRLPHHLSQLAGTHPKRWLGYVVARVPTIRRRAFAGAMELAGRAEGVDSLSRMEWAIRVYQPRPYPGQATLFVSSERVEGPGDANDLGWGAVVAGGLDIRVVPGGHMTVFDEPSLPVLVEGLGRALASRG